MKRSTLPVLLISLFFVLSGCYATPTDADVERVQSRFLILRFYAAFDPGMRDLPDKALFQKSCKTNRVQCEPVLEILEKKDPEFYGILMNEKKSKHGEILPGERVL